MKTAKDRKIVVHKLKTWAEYFKVIINGSKTFELRKNDRDFKVGDRLDLMEYDPKTQSFTGNHCQRFVSYIIGDNPFVNLNGYVILGLALDKEIEQDNGVKSLREIAMNMWNNLTLSDKIDLMGNFEEYVGRKPSTLTGREIEILFFGKREIEQGEQRKSAEGMINKIYNKIADDLKSARLEGWNTSDGDKYPLKDYLSQHGTIQTGIDEINNIVEQIEIEPLLKQYAEQYHRDKLREELVKVCKEIEIYIQTNKSYKSCIGMGYFAERFDEYLKDK